MAHERSIRCGIAGGLLLLAANAMRADTFQWPVDNVVVTQVYACRDCLEPKYEDGQRVFPSDAYVGGRNFHTGVDLGGYKGKPVKAAALGTVEKILQNDKYLGNVVILKHSALSVYTLYGHLDTIQVAGGAEVSQGGLIGTMGNSGPAGTPVHLHFEIKFNPDTKSQLGNWWGYTPGHPDLYGYADPRAYISNAIPTNIAPIVVSNTQDSNIEIRGAPGVTYANTVQTAPNGLMGVGQQFVAERTLFFEGTNWYFIGLPSVNTSVHGPNGGWVSSQFVTPVPDGRWAEVVNAGSLGVNVRANPGTGNAPRGKVFDSLKVVTNGAPQFDAGCSGWWYNTFLPGLPQGYNTQFKSPTTGWIAETCEQEKYLSFPPAPDTITRRCVGADTGCAVPNATVTWRGQPLVSTDPFGRFFVPISLCGTGQLEIVRGNLFFSALYTILCPESRSPKRDGPTPQDADADDPVEDIPLTNTLACGSPPYSTRFQTNDVIEVFGTGVGLRARWPNQCDKSIRTMPDGSIGTVVGGPDCCNGYNPLAHSI